MDGRFNPRAREGRDSIQPLMQFTARVSIHAPVKGATLERCGCRRGVLRVSIHAPVKGATEGIRGFPGGVLFQSTRP